MPKVFIELADRLTQEMFEAYGWDATDRLEEANLIQLVGGPDVHPCLYGSYKSRREHCDLERDKLSENLLLFSGENKVPIAGICRGAQFLAVNSGGSLFRDVRGHTQSHYVTDMETEETFWASSTHHQMIDKVGPDGIVVLTAEAATEINAAVTNDKTGKVVFFPATPNHYIDMFVEWPDEVEAAWWPEYKRFAFQPHPEYEGFPELANAYFRYLEELLEL